MKRRTRVLLADDHAIVAEGLATLLKGHFDLVGIVGNGNELIDLARKLRPDVIVADIAMPVLSGLEALRRLKATPSAAKVIFLTMHADAQLATEAFRAGASGYVLKQSAGEELIAAIQEVLQGRTYLTPLITKDFIANFTETTPARRQTDAAPARSAAAHRGGPEDERDCRDPGAFHAHGRDPQIRDDARSRRGKHRRACPLRYSNRSC